MLYYVYNKGNKMAYTNSKLVSYKKLSPNHSGERNHKIDRITPHCIVGQLTVESLGEIFSHKSRQASSNYGIGKDGKVGLYVEEKNRSWCSSSSSNDNRAITIECASNLKSPYKMNSTVYNKLVDLCVDICKRNGKTKLLFLGKSKTKTYKPKPNEMILTAHRWFKDTDCPGEWLYSRLSLLSQAVNKKLNASNKKSTASTTTKSTTKKSTTTKKKTTTRKKSVNTIAKEVIEGKWGVGAERKRRLIQAGYDYNAVQKKVNELL